jgi:hypothetical protein
MFVILLTEIYIDELFDLQLETDLEEMRRKLDMAEGSKSAMQQQVCYTKYTQ